MRSKKSKIWSILYNILRAIAYPYLLYIVLIYSHAKYNDPNGFKQLKKAFLFDFLSPVQLVNPADLSQKTHNNDFDSTDSVESIEVIMEYSTPLPPELILKPATTESIQVQTIYEDLQEQRNYLLDLAVQCHHLEAQVYPDTEELLIESYCYNDYYYYERKQNENLANPAKPYYHHLHQTITATKSLLNQHLPSLPSLQSFGSDLTAFISNCGEMCLPLAEIIYDPPVVNDIDFKTWLPGVKDSIQEAKFFIYDKLTADQRVIMPQIINFPDPNLNPNLSPITEPNLSNQNKVHSIALQVLNSNFPLLVAKGIIDPKKDIHFAALNDLPVDNVQNIIDSTKDFVQF